MSWYVYRNHTVEPLFAKLPDVVLGGYEDVSEPLPGNVDTAFWFYSYPFDCEASLVVERIEYYGQQLRMIVESIPDATTFCLFTMTGQYLSLSEDGNFSIHNAINNYNDQLIELASTRSNIKVLDLSRFLDRYPAEARTDWKYFYMSQMQISPLLAGDFRIWLDGRLRAIQSKRKKCLVLDLDNTLWGGVLGEDGKEGVKLSNNYPGSCFRDFQKLIKEAAGQGVILALCSKNNEPEVWDCFATHPDMVLKKDDLSSHRVNWSDKATNLREIADELNIGVDSLVFIDDSPQERALVEMAMPEVVVPAFPDKPYKLREFFLQVFDEHFSIYQLTDEDRKKTGQYQDNARRVTAGKGFSSLEDFIRTLDIRVEMSSADSFNIPRIAQMTQKTNQFNLTTQRYTESDIQKFVDAGAWVVCAAVKDKFGDSGITVAAIVEMDGQRANLDSFLLSCRILGRKIEFAIAKRIFNEMFDRGCRQISARYIPTAKNMQTESFLENFGFQVTGGDDGVKEYRLQMQEKFSIEDYYSMELDSSERRYQEHNV
ncbi:MAG: HAD-IIIC family phosphatase [Pirellulaceae bacterium]